jgi:tetratricopeptide (TPR) repeat protein
MVYTEQGKTDKALQALEEAADAVERLPPSLLAPAADRLTIGKICMNLKRYPRAAFHLQKYLQQRPGDPEATELLRQAQSLSSPNTATSGPSTRP